MLKKELVDRALAEIAKGYAQYQYFFDNLNSPAWLEPLADRGFFRATPEPKREGDYVTLPWWPESRYLVRMSKIAEAQEKVVEIALRIPDSENGRVHDDVAQLLRMPAGLRLDAHGRRRATEPATRDEHVLGAPEVGAARITDTKRVELEREPAGA